MEAELARHVAPGSLREMPCFSDRPCIGGPREGKIVEDRSISFALSEHNMLLVALAFDSY
jgi:hypothetical protein